MTELKNQVKRAQRRINLQAFIAACVWSLAICLGTAAVAIGIGKVWHLGIDPQLWSVSWLGGSILAAFVGAGIWTWLRRRAMVDAAIEIDRRYGLRERVSSCFTLSPDEVESTVGQALVADATSRVRRVDVREHFSLKANRCAIVPVLTGVLAVALVFVPDAQPGGSQEAAAKQVEVTAKRVRKSLAELKKKQADLAKELEEKGLKDASKLVKEVEQGVNEISKDGSNDRKQAMIKMNDLAKAIKSRRERLKGSEELQKRLNQLKSLKISEGPAGKIANALKDGDFKSALNELKGLRQRLSDAQLSPQEQQKLAKQMAEMQKRLRDMVDSHESAKRKLQEKIAELRKQGDEAAAQKLQRQLERLQAQDEQMQRLTQMANKMGRMAEAMREGKQQAAAQQMSELAQDLQAMQQQLEELQALDEALDQLANARDAMNCEACDGAGCVMCQGMGFDEGMPGLGMGEGQGRGDRPEEETNSNFYDSKVGAQPRRGKMVITGNVRGENKPGDALEAIKQAMDAAQTAEENPLTNVRLPRAQREQAQQYFDAVREGQ